MKFVFEQMRPDESRKQACMRLAPKVNVNGITLYAWIKAATPKAEIDAPLGSVEALKAEVAELKKENKELSRANDILKAASAFFGAELDRQSKR